MKLNTIAAILALEAADKQQLTDCILQHFCIQGLFVNIEQAAPRERARAGVVVIPEQYESFAFGLLYDPSKSPYWGFSHWSFWAKDQQNKPYFMFL